MHSQPGAPQRQINPLGDQFLVALIDRDLLADHRDLALGHILGATLHLVGVAELVIGPLPLLWAAILASERAGAHGAKPGQLSLEVLDAVIEDFQRFSLHYGSIYMLYNGPSTNFYAPPIQLPPRLPIHPLS